MKRFYIHVQKGAEFSIKPEGDVGVEISFRDTLEVDPQKYLHVKLVRHLFTKEDGPLWRREDGSILPIRDMPLAHLLNAIRKMERNAEKIQKREILRLKALTVPEIKSIVRVLSNATPIEHLLSYPVYRVLFKEAIRRDVPILPPGVSMGKPLRRLPANPLRGIVRVPRPRRKKGEPYGIVYDEVRADATAP